MNTKKGERKTPIIIAEDDEDDYMLTVEALNEAGIQSNTTWVKDGEELMELLKRCFPENGRISTYVKPGLILLDLNMPRMDGREVLREIKSDQKLKRIPVVVLSTSKSESDVDYSYDLGVNSFIQKPVRFQDYVKMVSILSSYWLSIVQLPE